MPMIVFCAHCAGQKGWPKPSIRVTKDPCDICGGHDFIMQRKLHPRTGQPIIKKIELKNFEHDAKFLPGTAAEAKLQQPLE